MTGFDRTETHQYSSDDAETPTLRALMSRLGLNGAVDEPATPVRHSQDLDSQVVSHTSMTDHRNVA